MAFSSPSLKTDELKMYEEYLLRLKRRKEMMDNKGFNNYPVRKLEHICKLNVFQKVNKYRTTKIICALGKSSNTEEIILEMMRTGMNVARLNLTSLGFEETYNFICKVRRAEDIYFRETKHRVAIAVDVAAPAARIGKLLLLSQGEEIIEGQSVWFTSREDLVDSNIYNVIILDVKEFPMMIRYFLPRSRLYIDDGALTVIVRENYGESVRCLVEQGGVIKFGSTVNFLWSQNFLQHCSDQIPRIMRFINESDVDMIMVSFIRDVSSLLYVKSLLKKDIAVIMKIENYINPSVLDNIIAVSDGVLIARGLIGIDLPIEKVFVLQNQIIAKCLQTVKPVFVGFQMLESMGTKPRPTRAEATDVANAVLASVDAVVLGYETAKGDYVVQSIDVMNKICLEAEATISNFTLFQSIQKHVDILCKGDIIDYTESACVSAVQASYNSRTKAIIVITTTGLSAYNTAALRPDCIILAVSRKLSVIRECLLYKGILAMWYNEPMESNFPKEIDSQLSTVIQWAKDIDLLKANDLYVCLTGRVIGKTATKIVRILRVPENMDTFKVSQPVDDMISKEALV